MARTLQKNADSTTKQSVDHAVNVGFSPSESENPPQHRTRRTQVDKSNRLKLLSQVGPPAIAESKPHSLPRDLLGYLRLRLKTLN